MHSIIPPIVPRLMGAVRLRSRGPGRLLGAVLGMVLLSGPAGATGSVSGTATITVTIGNICQLGTPPTLDFGSFPGGQTLASDKVVSAQIVVGCSSTTPYTIYLSDGLNRLPGSYRQMQNATTSSALWKYQLLNHLTGQVWDQTGGPAALNGTGGASSTGTGANQTFQVDGVIPHDFPVPMIIGAYSDTVTITVAY
jgi:spore coat protein U-like protein